MALFGDKCTRCGRRTKHSYENVPTCEDCEQQLRLRLKAEAEEARKCPIDDAAMAKEIVMGIVIDRCPTCRGVWLDGGELEYMKRGIEIGTATDLVRGIAYPY